MLDRKNTLDVCPVELDETFPLDDGENAVVMLADEVDVSQFLCDESSQLALVHVPLVDTRPMTTSTLLTALVRNDVLSPDFAEQSLEKMSDAWSWSANSYAARARVTL